MVKMRVERIVTIEIRVPIECLFCIYNNQVKFYKFIMSDGYVSRDTSRNWSMELHFMMTYGSL